jgi:hypothetical protein
MSLKSRCKRTAIKTKAGERPIFFVTGRNTIVICCPSFDAYGPDGIEKVRDENGNEPRAGFLSVRRSRGLIS